MTEQTPTTQEEKRPLSPADMLEGLKGALFTVTDKCMARGLDMGRLKNAAARCRFEGNHGQAERCSRDAKAAEQDYDALLFQMRSLEQTIAVLTVVTHPGFTTLAHREVLSSGRGARVWRIAIDLTPGAAGGYRLIGDSDRMQALLKAYAALKPQDGAPGPKGGPADA